MTDEKPRDGINAALPRARFAGRVDDVRALHGRVLDADAGAFLSASLRALAERIERVPESSAAVLASVILDLLLAAPHAEGADTGSMPPDRRGQLAEQARRVIDSRLGSKDLSPECLIAKLRVSRSELYNLSRTRVGWRAISGGGGWRRSAAR